jgi:cytochrome c1
MNNGCAGCHTLAAVGAKGTAGPDLGNLPLYARQAGNKAAQPLDAFIRQSITDPIAYTQPGFTKGLMQPFTLSSGQLDALVAFLEASSKGGKKR